MLNNKVLKAEYHEKKKEERSVALIRYFQIILKVMINTSVYKNDFRIINLQL